MRGFKVRVLLSSSEWPETSIQTGLTLSNLPAPNIHITCLHHHALWCIYYLHVFFILLFYFKDKGSLCSSGLPQTKLFMLPDCWDYRCVTTLPSHIKVQEELEAVWYPHSHSSVWGLSSSHYSMRPRILTDTVEVYNTGNTVIYITEHRPLRGLLPSDRSCYFCVHSHSWHL